MPALMNPTPEQLAEWDAWVARRPPEIQEMCRLVQPWILYRMKTTGQYVTVSAYDEADPENGWPVPTIKVYVDAEFNPMAFPGREVFGVDPKDLEWCDEFPDFRLSTLGNEISNDEW